MPEIVGLRDVHDILALTNKQHTKRAAVAFIQHGNPEEGFKYENICVFCGLTVGYVEDKEDMLTFGELQRRLYEQVSPHIVNDCKAGGHKFAVHVAQRPLNTERLPKEN